MSAKLGTQETGNLRTSRKRQPPLNDNGEPVTVTVSKRRRTDMAPTKPAPPKKRVSVQRKASVEAIPEESIHSESPRNPRHILEASDGSDDDNGDSSSAPMVIDSDKDVVEIIEKPEEDDEAELGLYLFASFNNHF